ncbi:MAG TPA: DUF1127 domain-containing protein [Afifellaceae bacterium]|nr:DUF1127 domain-containing protein [Afifellaceae bacterium]
MADISVGWHPHRLSLLQRATEWARLTWRAWRNRMAARQLQRFDDRLLSDIGLRRSDVDRAFALPLWEDPTRELARITAERRRARRRW